MQERLQSYIYALLAAADEDSDGRMIPPRELPEPRFSKPDSGLYAVITRHDGEPVWHAASLTGRDIGAGEQQTPGERRFSRLERPGLQLYALAFGVAWEDDAGTEALYTFTVAEDTTVFQAEIDSFRSTLWRWLGGMALVLMLAQGAILRWGLRPLRTVTADLQQIERGHAERLEGGCWRRAPSCAGVCGHCGPSPPTCSRSNGGTQSGSRVTTPGNSPA
jgi:two-component system sensor histidine kinase PhoQ